MKKFLSALALVAMVMFPFALQARMVTFNTNLPEAVYMRDNSTGNLILFNGEKTISVELAEDAPIGISANNGYSFESILIGNQEQYLYSNDNTVIYVDDIPEGDEVTINAKEKAPRVFTFIGNPDEVTISFEGNNYGKEQNVDGKWVISTTNDYAYININAMSGYVIASIKKSNGEEVLSSYEIGKAEASFSLSNYVYPGDETFTITCADLSDLRSVHVSLEVVDGEDSQIEVRRNGIYTPVPSSEWSDIALNPASELPLSISSATYGKNLYKVTVNGTAVEASYYGSFELRDLKDGDKILVYPNYPDVDVPVKFVFTNEGTEGAVKSVYVNSEIVQTDDWQAKNFTVKLGSNLSVDTNMDAYSIESVTINGTAYSNYGFSYTVSSEDGLEIVVTATKLRDYTLKVYYTAGAIKAYNNTYANDYYAMELPADAEEAELTVPAGSQYVFFAPAEGYMITEIINLATDQTVPNPVYVNDDMEIAVYTEEFKREEKCVIYLTPGDWQYHQVTLNESSYDLRKSIELENGYNFIDYSPVDRPLSIGMYPYVDVYLNGELCENNYGVISGMADMAPNSVIKLFPQNEKVSEYALTIDNQSDGGVEILADYITPLEGSAATVLGPTDVEFATVSAAAAENQSIYIIKVNGEQLQADENGNYIAHIEADSTISVEVDPNVSITEITAEGNAPIYNLQGVRVKNARGGIFIQNGRKIIR